MSAFADCTDEKRPGTAIRYVARRMSPDEQHAFEDHYVTCAACQEEVRLASAIASGLGAPPGVPNTRVDRRARRRVWTVGGLAVAATLIGFVLLRGSGPSALVALGAVAEPPAYSVVPVRGSTEPRDSLLADAMHRYTAHDYAGAVTGLRAAVTAGGDSLVAQFYLGASLLAQDRANDAADEFQDVIARGESAYRAEAHYFRAKALLRLRRGRDAQAELARLTAGDGATYDLGHALADSITRVLAR